MEFEVVKKELKRKGYKVSFFETSKDATEYINREIDRMTVGIGGSMTVEELGLYEKLSQHNEVYWHARTYENKTPSEIKTLSSTADVYISSCNAITTDGEIINIDGACNRISSICYGHKKVILVIGKNKLCKNYDEAIFRARNIAAPRNAQRLGKNTPCAVHGDKCYDCDSPQRICRVLSVLWSKPMIGEYEVVLINEELGF